MNPLFYFHNQPASVQDFKTITGAYWTSEMIIHTDGPAKEFRPSQAEWEMMRFLRPIYRSHQKNAATFNLTAEIPGQLVVKAHEDIPMGAIITEYLGEWLPHVIQPSSYRWGPIDGLHVRNMGAMVEDGFPNLQAFYLYGIDGLPLRVIFVAIEDIGAGELLTINYGLSHSVKIHYHHEYSLTRMQHFFASHPLDPILKKIEQKRDCRRSELGWKRTLELENLLTKLQYLFHTPSALTYLFLKNILSPAEVFQIYDRIDFRFYLLGYNFKNPRHQKIEQYYEIIRQYFSGDTRCDLLLQDLIEKIRVEIAIQGFMHGIVNHEKIEDLYHEAILWNDCWDAIIMQDREQFLILYERSQKKAQLLQGALAFAHQVHSPCCEWIHTLIEPDPPFKTVA